MEYQAEVERQSIGDKFNELIRRYIVDIAIVMACLIYVVRAVMEISATGKTVMQIIGDGIIAFIFGYAISRMLDLKGLLSGENTTQYIATIKEYAKAIDMITPRIDRLGEWCIVQNEKARKRVQTNILIVAGIKYEDFIAEDFNEASYTEEQRNLIAKAKKVKIKELTVAMLTSEGKQANEEPFDFGKSREEYVKQSSTTDFVSKAIFAVVFGYYGAQLIANFSWGILVWYAVQVVSFLIFGTLKYVTAYMFATSTLRNRYIRKTNKLYEFYNEQGGK